MSHSLPSPLPRFDCILLTKVERIVPAAEREEWSRTWQAELWHMHHRNRNRAQTLRMTADLSVGLVRDAFWLRTDSWRRALSGTPALCLASLLGVCLFSALLAFVLSGDRHSLGIYMSGQFRRFLFEAPLVVFVASVTASRGHIERDAASKIRNWIGRQLFFAAKIVLVLLVTFLLSSDSCQPIHAALPNTSDLMQTLFFVIFALFGLRWTFVDQENRCKQCLRLLATPVRVGRPSHNLLEWNGTELICKQGHGMLSVPEMETSWCQSSQWIVSGAGWERTASTPR